MTQEQWNYSNAYSSCHGIAEEQNLIKLKHLMIMRSWPRGVGQTLWDYDEYFTRPPVKCGEYLARLHGLLEMRNTVTEDMTTVEECRTVSPPAALTEQIVGEAEIGVDL